MLISSKVEIGINGIAKIPGDKSISHRSIIIPSLADGETEIKNILKSSDVENTMKAMIAMGVKIEENNKSIIIYGKGINSLKKPANKIDLGNSGTSARLLTGLLAAQNFRSEIYGDESLSKRPMKRIIDPLSLMGANITSNNNKLPVIINGTKLKGISYCIEIPSAQIKSGLILASLFINSESEIIETNITRDHTEIMLESFNADIKIKHINQNKHIFVKGQKNLVPKNIEVPSDLSSAAFFIVAALINKNSHLELDNINLNPTRDGILKAIKMMGGKINITNTKKINGEMIGKIEVTSSDLRGCELSEEFAKLMIDEYPILSIAAAHAKTPSIFKGLSELKVKESNRLELIRYNLDNCGIYCKVDEDNLIIDPTKKFLPKSNIIKTNSDHRIAMSFAIMGTRMEIPLKIKDSEFIKTSFPNFINLFNSLGGNLTE